ncbi:hypothetical protein H0H93_003485, partial [Arthromyces matolae]
ATRDSLIQRGPNAFDTENLLFPRVRHGDDLGPAPPELTRQVLDTATARKIRNSLKNQTQRRELEGQMEDIHRDLAIRTLLESAREQAEIELMDKNDALVDLELQIPKLDYDNYRPKITHIMIELLQV